MTRMCGIISQTDWKDDAGITILGKPRLGFLVSSGNMDSMVRHYYVSKKHRPTDAYTPGGTFVVQNPPREPFTTGGNGYAYLPSRFYPEEAIELATAANKNKPVKKK